MYEKKFIYGTFLFVASRKKLLSFSLTLCCSYTCISNGKFTYLDWIKRRAEHFWITCLFSVWRIEQFALSVCSFVCLGALFNEQGRIHKGCSCFKKVFDGFGIQTAAFKREIKNILHSTEKSVQISKQKGFKYTVFHGTLLNLNLLW